MLRDRIESVKTKISLAAKQSGKLVEEIKLVAVSKGFSSENIRECHANGLSTFGENYAQEAIVKLEELKDLNISWHFIGHLQSNKVKWIANRFDLIQSVSSLKIASEIHNRSDRPQKILIEVNLGGEGSKSGCDPEKLGGLLEKIQHYQKLEICGLMFMAPLGANENQQKKYFESAFELMREHEGSVSKPHKLKELSMGTSQDFEAAIRAGATMVRLGTNIFGERIYEPK